VSRGSRIKNILFVNWHEGNTPTLSLARDSIQRKFNVRVVLTQSHIITNKLFGERATVEFARERHYQ
jgi:hypothetical protein